MKTNLVNCVKKNDLQGFTDNLTPENLRTLLTDQEELLLLLAKDSWIRKLIQTHCPSEHGQEVIVSHRSKEIVKLLHDTWGISASVVTWAMSEGTPLERSKVIFALEGVGEAVAS